jgi:hypothetical protein
MKNFILIVFILISNVLFSQSIKVETRRGWTKTIPVSDIIEAGNDYGGTYDSDLDQTEITIEDKNKNRTVTVLVRKEDNPGDWHPNLDLQIRRTDNNINSNGGTSFQTITDFNSVFFYIKGKKNTVPIQYRINGISVLLPVQNYTTTIIFTVYD